MQTRNKLNIGILIMAAGRGERFTRAGGAGNKLNARFSDAGGCDRPVFEHTLRQALAAGLPLGVVTREDNAGVRTICAKAGVGVTLLDSAGLGDSIAAGVSAHANWDGWLIHLADMPFVTPDVFARVAEALSSHAIVRPLFRDQPGHPVGFSAVWREALCTLTGDNGARQLLTDGQVHGLRLNIEATVRDIDLPEQLPPLGQIVRHRSV